MLSIRLLRTGKKNQPFYRMVVTDKKNPPRAGRFLEIVGFFNPLTKEKDIKAERIKHWLSVGAKASDTVNNLLIKEKVIEGVKVAVHKKPKKKAVEAKAKAEADAAKDIADKEAEKVAASVENTVSQASEAPAEPVVEATPAPEIAESEAEKAE